MGAWRYSRSQPDIRDLDLNDAPLNRTAQGVYAMIDAPLWGDDDGLRRGHGFLRVGASDGDTGAFAGGGQAGLVIEHVFTARPNSALGFGVTHAALSEKFRRNAADEGIDLARGETIYELTYSDQLTDWLSLQPSLQWIVDPEGDRSRDDAVFIMRIVASR